MSITEFQGADGATRANFNAKIQQANNHITDYPSHITQLTCTKTGTVYALTGLTAASGAVSCMFKVDAAFVAGDTFTVNGTAYTLKTIDGTALTTGAWAQGALVHGIVDVDNKVLYVTPSAPVGSVAKGQAPVITDVHSISASGFYQGYTVANAPDGTGAWGFIAVQEGWSICIQAINFFDPSKVYYCKRSSGDGITFTWSSWVKAIPDYASGTIAATTAALRNIVILPTKSTILPTGLADNTLVFRKNVT